MAVQTEMPSKAWSPVDASESYDVSRWGKGYFSVGQNGHLLVHPDRNPAHFIDLKDLIDRVQLRGLDLPILVRFNGILKDRLHEIHRGVSRRPSGNTITAGRLFVRLPDQGQSAEGGRRDGSSNTVKSVRVSDWRREASRNCWQLWR